MLKLVQRCRVDPPRSAEAILATIARATAIDFIRRKRREREIFAPEPDKGWDPVDTGASAPDSPEDPVTRVRFLVLEFFRTSNSNCAELAEHFFREQDWEEVARIQERASAAVRKQWSRCVEELRRAVRADASFAPLREWCLDE
jgi:DNA-directed RNA polymerase specialized sigma24 family protein